MLPPTEVEVSGIRFEALYRLAGTAEEARGLAEALCVEQTIEFPPAYLPPGNILREVVGRIEELRPLPAGGHEARVSYALETGGDELPQILNVLFGNVSLIPGVRLEDVTFPPELRTVLPGPRFGRSGLRRLLQVVERPLLATALKPMGLSAKDLADLAYEFAMGGIHIVKDDHGLADQPFAPWRERVERVAAAIQEANARRGEVTLYCPNVTAPADQVLERAEVARELGAGGLLVAPGLTGFDFLRLLAMKVGLPLLAHPAFLGGFLTSPESGVAHRVLLGKLMRLAGADAVIFPNLGGRFPFGVKECQEIIAGTSEPMGGWASVFPMPGGGMTLERVPELLTFYGNDVVLLIGGDLFRSGDVRGAAERFRELTEQQLEESGKG